jgi:hypothetical protein
MRENGGQRATYVALNGGKQNFLAASLGTDGHSPGLASLASHNRTFPGEMLFHPGIRVLTGTNGYWYIAKGAIRSDPIMLALVILGTGMCRDHKVLLTERFLAVLAFEGQEVNEKTGGMGALFADSEQLVIAFDRGCHVDRVKWVVYKGM